MRQMAEKRDEAYWAIKLDEKTKEPPRHYPYEELDISLGWMGDINRLAKSPPQYAIPALFRGFEDGKRMSTAKEPLLGSERVIPFSVLSKPDSAHYRVVFENYFTLLEQWYEEYR